MRRTLRWGVAACLTLALVWAAFGARIMVVDAPQRADAILVLAGEENRRPRRGLELLHAGYAPRLVLSVAKADAAYGASFAQLAQEWVEKLPPEDRARTSVCTSNIWSTLEEARAVPTCLDPMQVKTVLVTTSDYHTRRALRIFRKNAPQYSYSVAALYDDNVFGVQWWKHREWAKTFLRESAKTVWWCVVDRWR